VTRATAAMAARASPRNPRVAMRKRSSGAEILLVAWRAKARATSAAGMPHPSSATRMRERPPPSVSTSIREAPASRAFSTSSLTTEAGRSITSPAAI
jgi:hypothetical protein